ncbi:CAP domain-containing protein [Neobacillus sp. LXY-1]|uniref:CAP domain-containing protein n=1 Tax=Neobacillus sp. LXY-1 TaxID=3379133 RepID=UPI003EE1C4EB
MIKKSAVILLTSMLSIGLAACNNNDKNNINDTGNRFGMNSNNRNDNFVDVRNDRFNIDHNGPLTEDYRNRGRDDDDDNLFRTGTNRHDMISAYQTTLNSDQYPHTQAVVVKDAKYSFVPIGSNQNSWVPSGIFQQIQPYLPNVNMPQQAQPAPAQRAPQQVAPAPAQRVPQQVAPAPAQKVPAPTQTTPAPQQSAQKNTATTAGISQFAQQVINLTNEQRSKNGLPALKADTQLSSVAQKKAVDMQQNHYFSHTSPTYGSPFDMMRDFGVTYKAAGENIAQGQRTPQEVVTAWMNSEGHRKNILSSNFTHIGVGYESAGNHWSQMFIGK